MVRKIKRTMSRILASVLACGMLITYCPSVAYAMDENPPEVQEEVTEPEVSAPVETQPSEPAPEVTEPAPAPSESPEVTPVEDNEQEVTPPAEEEPVITDSEQEEPDDEDLADPTEDEEANEEETIPEEEEVVEEELTTLERPKMKMMMLGAAPGGTPGNDPTPDPKGTPEDAEKYYPNNSNMQDLYIQYGDEFKDASDKMIDEPSNDKLVEVVNTMNDSKVSNPEDVPGLDENRKSIGEVVMVEGEDKDGDGSPDPQYFKYEKDPVTNEVKITRLEEKAVEGLVDSKVEEEAKINEIIAKYGEENTDVKKYYDEVPKEIKQPKNGGHHVNLFPTNQNGVKFEEPITTTDSNGNMVYLWNYKFDFAGETATVEQGNLRWDTSKKRDYGDRGFGCWIFVDKNNKEWNLTNMSTTSTSSKQIKAVPYSDDYMNSLEKGLYKWFVENGDKNGQGNTYQYGDIEKIFKYAIVNAEGWNYFEALESKIIAKSKLPDTPPGPEPPGPEPPGPEPPGPEPPGPEPPGPEPPGPNPPGPNPPGPNPPGPKPPVPNPQPDDASEPASSPAQTVFMDNSIQKIVYLVVVDDNIVYTPNQVALVSDALNGIRLAKPNVEFRFVYASMVDENTLNGIDSVVTVSALRKEAGLSPAIMKAVEARGMTVNYLNLWFYDDPAVIDDGMENKIVIAHEGNAVHSDAYIRSNAEHGSKTTGALEVAGSEFATNGLVTYETLVGVLTS